MLTDRELMDIHIRALFTHDARSRLLRVNEPGGGGPTPLMFLGRTQGSNRWRFRADLLETHVEELTALCEDEPIGSDFRREPRHVEAYVRLLSRHAPAGELSAGPAYHFGEYPEPKRPSVAVSDVNAEVLRGGFEKLIEELPSWQPFFAVMEDGRAVSVCRSVRITPEAHEAGVETLPEFRRKGYAKDVVAAWALAVRSLGAIPLYSTSWENLASQGVARKLGLMRYGADFQIM